MPHGPHPLVLGPQGRIFQLGTKYRAPRSARRVGIAGFAYFREQKAGPLWLTTMLAYEGHWGYLLEDLPEDWRTGIRDALDKTPLADIDGLVQLPPAALRQAMRIVHPTGGVHGTAVKDVSASFLTCEGGFALGTLSRMRKGAAIHGVVAGDG
jgi:hypothetical protein